MTKPTLEDKIAELRSARAALVPERGPDHMASPRQKLLNRIEALKSQAFVDPAANVKDEMSELTRRLYEMDHVQGRSRGR